MTKLSEQLCAMAQPIWDAQWEHPFVQGILDSSLPLERFANWVRQDYVYLMEYARLLGLAAARADRLESMSWYAQVMHLTLHTEMKLHRSYAERFGITTEQLEAETKWPTTQAYTDFLLRHAAMGDRLDLVAALLPCAWGYLHLAQRMARQNPPSEQRYADWIAMYNDPEFEKATTWLCQELDRLGQGIQPDKKQQITEIFLLSSRYELKFWDMCWNSECW